MLLGVKDILLKQPFRCAVCRLFQRAFDVTERITTCQLRGLVHGSVHLLKMSVCMGEFSCLQSG